VKKGQTARARKKWTLLFGILAIVAFGFCGYEFWQWVLTFSQTQSAAGTFSVSSVPAGAVVHWKGRELGHTPLKQYALPPGDQVIELTAPGYQPCPIEFTVKPGSMVDLGARSLSKQLGKLKLVTDPAGVSYLVVGPDKKSIAGMTPDTIDNLALGKYQVKLVEPGWPDYAQVADINSGDLVEISRQFKGGNVDLTSDPAGATIFVGGSKLGTAPLTANLPLGPVEVTSSFGTLAAIVQTLVPEAQKTISFHFKHSYGTLLVSSDRADAVLIVDGVDCGHPPAQLFLSPGNHKLLLTAPNAPDKTRRVDLIEGQHASVQINFGGLTGEVAAVSNAGASPSPSATPSNQVGITAATPANTPQAPKLVAKSTPTPLPSSTPAPEATPEKSASSSEEQPIIPPANPGGSPTPLGTPPREQPKVAHTLTRSVTVTKKEKGAVTPSPSTPLTPEQAKTKKEAYQLLQSQVKARDDALKTEKQYIEYQIKNSSGAVREEWKYKLAQWRQEKARADQDRAATQARLKEEWR
jgi:hypothetical protein